ncbi:MAG: hypothetical protein CME59_11515 [Halioglobus sp.]|nr:hypothetical protein [Halioglobus sp.]|tara:strand:+ start:1479 stop:2057 length:579 start_codon:yes stop_codon:yes gene_type:complete
MNTFRIAAVIVLVFFVTSRAFAGLVRYEVTMPAFQPGAPDAYGYLIFENPEYGGNIVPYLVDWLFHDPDFGGLNFDSSNSNADTSREFIVDAQGDYLSDNILCFGIDEACAGAIAKGLLLLNGSGNNANAIFTHPGGAPVSIYRSPIFSEPISVPIADSMQLLGIALVALFLVFATRTRPLRRHGMVRPTIS